MLDREERTQPWTQSEDLQIVKLWVKYGNKWAKIAREIGRRTDNDIKNRFYKISKKYKGDEIDKLIDKLEH
jgi:hypothetical protein